MQRFRKITEYPVEILIGTVVLASHIYIASLPTNSLLNWFHTDDAFYYYKTAFNIAQGLGSTFDGLGLTNGYHPLWMLICVPVFSLARFDIILPLRIIVLIQGMLNAATGILIFQTLRRSISEWLAAPIAFAWVLVPGIYNITMVGGLESGINAFFLMLLLNQSVQLEEKNKPITCLLKDVLVLGIVAALTVLSRLDNIFVVCCVSIWVLWKARSSISKIQIKKLWENDFIKLALVYSIPLIVLVGSYILWNVINYKHFSPISGQVKIWWGDLGNTVYGGTPPRTLYKKIHFTFMEPNGPWGFFVTTKEWFYRVLEPSGFEWLSKLRWILLMGIGLLVLLRKNIWHRGKKLVLLPFFIGVLLQSGYYPAVEYIGYREWYWIGEMLVALLLIGILLDSLFMAVCPVKLQSKITLLFSILSILLICLIINVHYKHVTSRYPLFRPSEEQAHFYINRGRWLTEHSPGGAIIGATGAGALGYFTPDRTIIPLDGLINNFEYFESLKQGKGADYLSEIGMDYVFGASWIKKATPYAEMFAGNLEKVDTYRHIPEGVENYLYRFDTTQSNEKQ